MTRVMLEVQNLRVSMKSRHRGEMLIVEGVSLEVKEREIVAIVGESGCGKTLTVQAILGILPRNLRSTADVLDRFEDEPGNTRHVNAALIPADPGAVLNPLERSGDQLIDGMKARKSTLNKLGRRKRVLELFESVGIHDPARTADAQPHQLSGGMQQRVVIAMGVDGDPRLLVADEPTTALDVTVQAQVLELLLEVRDRTGCGILLVTHDMTTVAELCDRVIVMYAGEVVESGSVIQVCTTPTHPYTRALIDAVPPLGGIPPMQLRAIEGGPPEPGTNTPGCKFAPRCDVRKLLGNPDVCVTKRPSLAANRTGGASRCHFVPVAEPGLTGTRASVVENEVRLG